MSVTQAPPSFELYGLDEATLCEFAEGLGRQLQGGDVLLLEGTMGAGKTTFVRALAHGLGVSRPDRVRSPTFNLRLEHAGTVPLIHVDLCRLVELSPTGELACTPAGAAIEALDLPRGREAGDDTAVLVVEWAQAWSNPPHPHVLIHFAISPKTPEERDLRVCASPSVWGRVEAALASIDPAKARIGRI